MLLIHYALWFTLFWFVCDNFEGEWTVHKCATQFDSGLFSIHPDDSRPGTLNPRPSTKTQKNQVDNELLSLETFLRYKVQFL